MLRVATNGAKNACSMLYGAAARAAKALGYRRIVTYTMAVEPGTILRAAGWSPDGEVRPEDSWASKGRPRYDRDLFGNRLRPTGPKIRWVKYFAAQDKGQRPDAEFPLKAIRDR